MEPDGPAQRAYLAQAPISKTYQEQVQAVASSSRHKSSERLHELLKEIGDLHDKKQRDYGTAADPFANVRATTAWGIPAWIGAMIRANDKIVRLRSMAVKGELVNESAVDSFKDLAVYALIACVLFEEENGSVS